jgi:hypothetical protein
MYNDEMILDPMIITYGAIAIVVILIGWIIRLEIKIHRLLLGKNARSLEDSIVEAHNKLMHLDTFERDSIAYFKNVEARLKRSIQAIETVRFNPFKGTGEGGNQSFSTTLVDEHGDGVILSSLYSRDRVSIFSKPLEKFQSEYELTEEEQRVVDEAKKNLHY